MAILGSTSEPTNSAEAWQGTNRSMHAHVLTFPSGGPWRIQSISVWCAGYLSNTPARHVVWNGSSGAVDAYESSDHTVTQRTFSASGSDLYTKNVWVGGVNGSYLDVPGGTTVIVGVQRQESSYGLFFGKTGSGSHRDKIADSYLDDMASNTTDSSGEMGVYITYIAANSLPTAPSWSSPAAGSIVGDTTPNLVFIHNDADDDPVASWDLQIDTTTGNGVEPDWASLSGNGREDLSNQTSGISGDTITYTSIAKDRNQWYAARARTADAAGDGAWSVTRFFKINQLPSVSARDPG